MSDRFEADSETDGERPLTPEDAFALLGDPTRLDILRALWETSTPLSFSTLREHVAVEDTGRFNYHLGKLRGHFVRKSETGYELRQAGLEVVRAVLAGVINESPVREPEPIDAVCPDCDGALVVSYDGHGTVACRDCDTVWLHDEFPPAGLVERDAAALAWALELWTRHRSLLAFEGVCPTCASETENDLEETERGWFVDRVCGHCGYRARAPLWALTLWSPPVSGFLAEAGVDLRGCAFWELVGLATDRATADGFIVEISPPEAAETLRVHLDSDLSVVETTRAR